MAEIYTDGALNMETSPQKRKGSHLGRKFGANGEFQYL